MLNFDSQTFVMANPVVISIFPSNSLLMGLDRAGTIIARALQEYGMISVDHSGSFKIYVEDLINNPFAKEDWTDPDLNLTKESIYGIPYASFHVLELPPGYWEPSENTVYHGQCIAFPKTP